MLSLTFLIACLFACMFDCVCFVNLLLYLFVCLLACMFVCFLACLFVCLFACVLARQQGIALLLRIDMENRPNDNSFQLYFDALHACILPESHE